MDGCIRSKFKVVVVGSDLLKTALIGLAVMIFAGHNFAAVSALILSGNASDCGVRCCKFGS